jgi:serine protease Do
MSRISAPLLVAALVLVVSACGGGAAPTTTIAPSSTTTSRATTTTAPQGPSAASSLEEVKGAVVRIVAEGTFVDPEAGAQYNSAGVGSGFIIDPSGLAVTNNHVVTGAAFLQVYLAGDTEPHNARVLGVSECSDLAVIDIDGDDFPYLEWYDGNVTAGMRIYAVGFPLGTEEYTVLDGIVSKEKADGETNWASVDNVIEESADILPGNSGGPVVTEDGQVVAISYAGDNAGQAYAIAAAEAHGILDQLEAGQNVTSLGINGQAFVGDGYSGIWVASVQSGSPAQKAGIEGGDIVTTLENLVLATDGTMADYCDILRSHTATDPLAVEVYRWSTGEYLDGTLNTDEPLTVSLSLQDNVDVVDTGAYYTAYTTVYDDTGTLSVDVPIEWADTFGGPWILRGDDIGYAIVAAPSIDDYYNSWDAPGIFFGASSDLVGLFTEEDLLDMFSLSDSCDSMTRDDYDDGLYTGRIEVSEDCGGVGAAFVNIVASPTDGSFIMLLQMQVVSDADLEALDRAASTFIATP